MATRPLYTDGDFRRATQILKGVPFDESYREPFRRDYARLLHSPAFRRLQGKTQLFPSHESDFFRNRLTHSLEVAQIAKTIAIQLNKNHAFFRGRPIDCDLMEFAGLAHDLGHPPFGHNGEEALNECMNGFGGFEGNAQTLRILTRLEKREVEGGDYFNPIVRKGATDKVEDHRHGLNLTYRSLAAILKYHKEIPEAKAKHPEVRKGFYHLDHDIVKLIVSNVCPDFSQSEGFKVVECSLMDISDDIAYSTYDLEDAFKAGFLSPLKMFASSERLKSAVAEEVRKRGERYYPDVDYDWSKFGIAEVDQALKQVFSELVDDWSNFREREGDDTDQEYFTWIAATMSRTSRTWSQNAYLRTRFTSALVSRFANAIEVLENEQCPCLSQIRLRVEAFIEVEVVKNFAYQALIMSPMLKLAEYRGKDIIKDIFLALDGDGGHELMPSDYRDRYELAKQVGDQSFAARVVCDYIAGMTDRYAIEFWQRLKGANPASMHKPH